MHKHIKRYNFLKTETKRKRKPETLNQYKHIKFVVKVFPISNSLSLDGLGADFNQPQLYTNSSRKKRREQSQFIL